VLQLFSEQASPQDIQEFKQALTDPLQARLSRLQAPAQPQAPPR
jgi:hypothetical protein